MAKYKGVIKFISREGSKWALVREYRDTTKGDVAAEAATVTSTKALSAEAAATVTSTVAPNASEQFTLTTSEYNVNITIDGQGTKNIDISGDGGASETYSVDSIIARINSNFTGNPASKTGSGTDARIKLTGGIATSAGVVTVAAGTTLSALTNVFNATTLTANGSNGGVFNLATNYNVKITVDGGAATTVNLQGGTPASSTMTEIAGKINTALAATIATVTGFGDEARIVLTSPTKTASSYIKVAAGDTLNALTIVFADTTLEDYGVTVVEKFEDVYARHTVVRANFSSYSVGNTITYTYKAGAPGVTEHDITIL